MAMSPKEKSARFRAAHPAYHRERVAAERAAWFAGKKCEWCGSERFLEIDHVDPNLKVSHRIFTWEPQRRAAELAKCRVLCRLCHREHSRQQQLKPMQHGTLTAYSGHRCRCNECKAAARAYQLSWRRARCYKSDDAPST